MATSNPEAAESAPSAEPAGHHVGPALEQAREAADSVLGANPIVGATGQDLRDAAARLFKLLSLNPLLVARKQTKFALELARILRGHSAIVPDPQDRRFAHPVWQNNGYYRRLMQTYLAWARNLREILDGIDADAQDMERARFMLMQVIAAAAPTNYPLGNPGFLANAWSSRGRSIARGLRHLVHDLRRNHGMPSQVDKRPFQVGRTLANSRGAVVFRNPVCEVIQYVPTVGQVDATPVLVVPPQINKYYIVDLAEDKSFVRYAGVHGQQVFTISWRNPTAAQRDWGLETYVSAAHEAIDAVLEITDASSLKLVAACTGGFTAAVLLGHMAAIGEAQKVACLTLLVTVLDTRAKSLLGLFAGDAAIKAAIGRSRAAGVLEGAGMARAFAWLRPQDLVWNFVANNYLLGNDPPAFDILYWNNDTTRLPAQFHADLLNSFKQNPLVRPDGMQILGSRIDLGRVDCDIFIVAGATDHITPWQACYRSTRLFGGDVQFVLSSSGHIQSIVNPPSNPQANSKAKYFLHHDYALDAERWLEQAQAHQGSWWPLWLAWAGRYSAGECSAPKQLGSARFQPADAAPGRYVFQR